MTACAPASSNSNVTLPSIHTILPPSTFSSPASSPLSDDEMPFTMPLTQQKLFSHDKSFQLPRLHLPMPMPSPTAGLHSRRVSTASAYSVPSLTHSPSPSPSPPLHARRRSHVRLIPCALHAADVVVVAALSAPPQSSSTSAPPASAPRAVPTLLVGPAVSRLRAAVAAKNERTMHAYRVVRERRV